MSKSTDSEYLEPFIDATIASAARFRRVLIVVILTSVLAFGAFWNAAQWSWINSRIRVAHNAEAYLSLEKIKEQLNDTNQMLKEHQEKLARADLSKEEVDKLRGEETQLRRDAESKTKEKDKLEKALSDDDYKDARQWVTQRGIKKPEHVTPYVQRLETIRVENVLLIRIPFFGIILDVNDLGLIGGFTFVVVLMWFRFSLWREYYNLRSSFKEAKSIQDLEFCYKSLAMSQVLTVPPSLLTHQPKERPWGKVVRILYFLPLTVQLTIMVYDGVSFQRGWVLSKFNTVFGLSFGIGFLFINALLTYWCFRLSIEIDKEWKEAADNIRKAGSVEATLKDSQEQSD
jgi:hypothetical protein